MVAFEMTPKERILAALRGEPRDHTPFSPFLAYYFESLPQETQAKGQLAYLEAMGADPLLRGFCMGWHTKSRRCSVRTDTNGRLRTTVYSTPIGQITALHTYLPESNTWFLTRHPIQTLEDLDILACYYEDLTILEDVNALNHTLEELGDRGLMLPLVGCECKSCFQNLLEYWVGTENLTYFVYDDPEKVQQVLAIMGQKALDTVEITLKSDAQGAIFWEDTSTTNLSPAFYEAYVEPEITAWAGRFRQEGKLLLQHACGHLKAVLPLMSRQGISGVESLSPAPTGNISVGEALKILPEHQSLVGGLEPTFLLNSTMEQLERHVRELLALTKGRRYILANSDSCPPGVAYEKFLLLAKLARENTES